MQQYVITELHGMEILETNDMKHPMVYLTVLWLIQSIGIKYNQQKHCILTRKMLMLKSNF